MNFTAHIALLLLTLTASPEAVRVIAYADKPVTAVRGLVVDSQGARISGVKVELFDHPEIFKGPKSVPSEGEMTRQHKLGEVQTDKSGAFEIVGIHPGKYELRLDRMGFAFTDFIFELVSADRRDAQPSLRIRLELGAFIDRIVIPGNPPKQAKPAP